MSFTLDDLLGPTKSDGFEMFGSRTPQPSTSKAAGATDDMFSDWKTSDKPSKPGENTKKPINFNSLVDFDLDSGFSKFDISMSDLDFADTNSDSPKAEPADARPKLDQGLSLASSMNGEKKDEFETGFEDCETSGLPETEKHTEEPTQDADELSQDIPELNESEIQSPREDSITDNEPTDQNSPGNTSDVSPTNPTKNGQTSLDDQQDEPLEPSEPTKPLQSSKPVEPLESSEPDEPPESPKPAEPLESSMPAERLDSAKPAEPLESSKPAEPLESSKSAEPLKSSKPADTQATKKSARINANSQGPNGDNSEVLMAKKSMLELNKPSAASDPGKGYAALQHPISTSNPGQQRSISSTAQEKSVVKPVPLALRTSINPGVESARLGNRTSLKISTSTGQHFSQGKTTSENGAMGSRTSSLRKLASISSKPIVATSVQPRVAHVQVDEASPPATSAKLSALESQLNNTFVFGQHSALEDSTSLNKDVTYGSKPDAQEILLIEPAEEKQDKGDMTLSFPAAGKMMKERDDVQNMGMVAMLAGGGQLMGIQNKEIGDMSPEFEGEASGVDELDQVYRMLQRKHEEAKELLVRVMINHNLLVRMNEKYSYENIEKKRQDILSLISRGAAEE
ncbi:unnamed protein product [Closterium sp. Yama58-4]|nr:unnamed protein product [Closterium sp. Yama58-4]